ncbi:ATP-binding protein [Deinococcus sp.]|uniref:sensor histidine kinase n=1 Tax=Deinococcus sp. TaxID=47478 RepID=UPI002869BB97|nr:ATP-binding protein [Deinococcus sp.]
MTVVVVATLTVFIVYRAGTELALLSPGDFRSLQDALRQHSWSGMVELSYAVSQEVVLTSVFGTLLALGFALLLSAIYSRYVGRLIAAIERLAAGDFNVRINPGRGPYELTVLEHGLNRTAERLEHLEQERQFETAAVAHELRTPITALRLRVLGLQDGIYPLTPQELEPLNRQLGHLERLADSLQTLTLADAGRLDFALEPTAPGAVFDALQLTFGAEAKRRDIHLTFGIVPPASALSSAFRLQQALGNLIQNALRHTPAGGQIQVEATVHGTALRFSVSDSGPGVPDAALGRLFERYYRLDESRTRHSGGSGLGLAIVQAIAQAHGGHVWAARAAQGGLLVEFEIPVEHGGVE